MNYPIVIHKDKNSDYGVTVPDLPGCFSAGETIEEAIDNAKEAILCHLEGLQIDNEDIPLPNSVETHQNNNDYTKGTWVLIKIDMTEFQGKAKRVNVTIPEKLLYKIDSYAEKEGDTRSGLLVTAAMEYISKH